MRPSRRTGLPDAQRAIVASTPPAAGRGTTDYALDIAGFAIGLGCAWALGWQTRDLVWSLWLSSLVLGYATLLLAIARARPANDEAARYALPMKAFLVLFFTVHFGGFHFGHSMFLMLFFPFDSQSMVNIGPTYAAVFGGLWPWLFAAALAERHALRAAWHAAAAPTTATRAGAQPAPFQVDFFSPYKNVIRMHLLIFVFFGLWAAGIDGIGVYALVYAVYFWPRRRRPAVGA